MNNSITVLDLLAKCHGFILVHGPDLVEPVFIALFKSLKFLLEKQELFCKLFIIFGCISILLGVPLILSIKSLLDSCEDLLELSLLLLEGLDLNIIDLLSFSKDSVVKLKLLLVESVDRFHVFHAFLENLHLFLKLYFLFGLIIGVLSS